MESKEGAPGRGAALAMARALALLVERLTAQGTSTALPAASPGERRDAVREALRALAAAARVGALHCHVDELGLHMNDHVVLPVQLRAEPTLLALARRLVNHAVGTLTIRQGAAPGELLTLGRLLAEPSPVPSSTAGNDATPSRTPTEGLRSWSVLVTPASTPLVARGPVSPTVGSAVARLRTARSDDAARQAVNELIDLADEAEARMDALSLESIALALTLHARAIGPAEGRLATEGGLRRLLREPVIALLATRIPHSADRDALIATLARTGELGVHALVAQLMTAEDRPARRSYFDAIVAQDAGASQLREALVDPRWYVVRNAAALLGEMGVAEADTHLIPLLSHLDERIRIAAARALTRLRTARGLLALQQCLGDPNTEVRRLAAAAFGLASDTPGMLKPHSVPLATALAAEAEEDVALEMIASLGKLGSADAVQRLIRFSLTDVEAPSHPAWFRVATMEALVAARGHAAVSTLEVLANDTNDDVTAAARRLLSGVLLGE